MQSIHKESTNNQKNTNCSFCIRNFQDSKSMKQHCRRVHIKQFPCSFCDYKAGQRADLQKHELVHSKGENLPNKLILSDCEQKIIDLFEGAGQSIDIDFFSATIAVEGLSFCKIWKLTTNPDREQIFTRGMQEIAKGYDLFQIWVNLENADDIFQSLVDKGYKIMRFKNQKETPYKHFVTTPTCITVSDLIDSLKRLHIKNTKIVSFGMKMKIHYFCDIFGQALPYCSTDVLFDFGREFVLKENMFTLFAADEPCEIFCMCGTSFGSLKYKQKEIFVKVYPVLVHFLKLCCFFYVKLARERICSLRTAIYRLEIAKRALTQIVENENPSQFKTRIEVRGPNFRTIEQYLNLGIFDVFRIRTFMLSKYQYISNIKLALDEAYQVTRSEKINASYKVLNMLGFSYNSIHFKTSKERFRGTYGRFETRSRKGTGLANAGNSCFINAVFQSLQFSTFTELFERRWSDIVHMLNKFSKWKTLLLKEFINILKIYRSDECPKLARFIQIVSFFRPEFNGNVQQDAHDFLLYLINQLQEEFNSETFIEKLQCKLFITIKCLKCGEKNVELTNSSVLSIPVPDKKLTTLKECFDLFLEDENCEYKCRVCDSLKGNLKIDITYYPSVFIVHFKRFRTGQKLQTNIKYDTELDFGGKLYTLASVIEHQGDYLDQGHYVAYRKYGKEWVCYDDSNVFASDLPLGAYILLYVSAN